MPMNMEMNTEMNMEMNTQKSMHTRIMKRVAHVVFLPITTRASHMFLTSATTTLDPDLNESTIVDYHNDSFGPSYQAVSLLNSAADIHLTSIADSLSFYCFQQIPLKVLGISGRVTRVDLEGHLVLVETWTAKSKSSILQKTTVWPKLLLIF